MRLKQRITTMKLEQTTATYRFPTMTLIFLLIFHPKLKLLFLSALPPHPKLQPKTWTTLKFLLDSNSISTQPLKNKLWKLSPCSNTLTIFLFYLNLTPDLTWTVIATTIVTETTTG